MARPLCQRKLSVSAIAAAGEYEAQKAYKVSRELCAELRDDVSKELFDELLADEESHIDFLETQLQLLKNIGAERYGQLNAAPASEGV